MHTALTEITLVLFTALAPSGLVAYMICACMVVSGRTLGLDRQRLAQGLWLPIVIVLVGLVASATHLGNPSNALYVLSGVGRSPLSNEVFAGILFLAVSGGFWLYAFVRKPRSSFMHIWPLAAVMTAVLFLVQISLAYSAGTVITWSTPLVPAMILSNAFVGGPMCAVLTLDACALVRLRVGGLHAPVAIAPFARVACVVSGASLAANAVLLCTYGSLLNAAQNSVANGSDLLVPYVGSSVAYGVLAVACICVVWRSHAKGFDAKNAGESPDARTVKCVSIGVALMFVGLFLTRFLFYMAHMTVGVAI